MQFNNKQWKNSRCTVRGKLTLELGASFAEIGGMQKLSHMVIGIHVPGGIQMLLHKSKHFVLLSDGEISLREEKGIQIIVRIVS